MPVIILPRFRASEEDVEWPTIEANIRNALAKFLDRVRGTYPVKSAILFGSRARGTHHAESDADVAVLLAGLPVDRYSTDLAMADIAFDVLLDTGILVQPLPVWEGEWAAPERHSNPRLIENIRREGIEL